MYSITLGDKEVCVVMFDRIIGAADITEAFLERGIKNWIPNKDNLSDKSKIIEAIVEFQKRHLLPPNVMKGIVVINCLNNFMEHDTVEFQFCDNPHGAPRLEDLTLPSILAGFAEGIGFLCQPIEQD